MEKPARSGPLGLQLPLLPPHSIKRRDELLPPRGGVALLPVLPGRSRFLH